MSKFISARLGLDGVQSGHKDIYWFRHERPYVQWVLLLLVLLCTGVLVVGGYKLSREGADPRSLVRSGAWMRGCVIA
jgi:hypothetical protein